MELLLVRGDFFEQLREALAAEALKVTAALSGHLHTYAHIVAEAVPHDPYTAAEMRLLISVVTGFFEPVAARSQTEEVFHLLDRHAVVQRKGKPVYKDYVFVHVVTSGIGNFVFCMLKLRSSEI